MNNHLLTIEQLANITGFTPKAIRGWCQRGDVFPTARKVPNIPKGQWRILSDDVALVEMLDGHTDNARMLADQNRQITELQSQLVEFQAQIAEWQKNHSSLINSYNALVEEAQELDKQIEAQQDIISDLKRYKDHYEQQRQRGQRRAA